MVARPSVVSLLLVGSLGALDPVLGQTAPALGKADFTLGGLTEGMDSGAVRRRLGKPTAEVRDSNPLDVGAQLVTWRYSALTVEFFSTDQVVGLSTTDPAVPTTRGLRVGDSVEKLKRLYGQPSDSYENDMDYADPDQDLHVMRITISNGRIVKIYLGWLLD